MADNYERRFRLDRVIDGDTIVTASIDLGYHTAATPGVEYRLLRVNSPELHRAATKEAGLVAKAYTTAWLTEHAAHDPNGWLWARTQQTDSFGRYLAEVTCGQGHNLSDDLLGSGNAVPFP